MVFETEKSTFFLKMLIFPKTDGAFELGTGGKPKTLTERKSYLMWFWPKDFFLFFLKNMATL